jgi:hypothetical protein
MDTLALKLVLTPVLVGTASLAGRRWGPVVSGWFVGLPLTSGPIAFFLALNNGVAFAAATAVGTLAGAISQAAFCLAYGWLALRCGWLVTVSVSCLGFAASTAVLQRLALPMGSLFLMPPSWPSLHTSSRDQRQQARYYEGCFSGYSPLQAFSLFSRF